ncbi:MAG: branched-chain amino acid ABC transporter substrate-binding protein [Deltaproteobacteria bacterium HGW-Deltaproteobacteria-6]|nr:MAG: branched-chain amino acid ABC transporter substrate-binding protein [Deltaproteobacteria bacterium HGW-Deltaproteobacteria-6]
MKRTGKIIFMVLMSVLLLGVWSISTPSCALAAKDQKTSKAKTAKSQAAPAAKAAFDASKMGNMNGWDPANWVNPEGDTFRMAIVWPHSGPGALNGQMAWLCATFVAYDINKRGGIMVDGKKKKIALFKADSQSKPDIAKKICERMVLQEKVHVLVGTSGSNIMKIANEVATKYKVISLNIGALSDDLQDATNFSRYAFMTSDSTEAVGRGMAYFYGQIRKKEKKFYILCQDYSFGRGMAEGFKKGLKEYYPEAQIVGEDYHKLFLTDFAPYLTKIKSSGAEVIWTADWSPDAANLLKQSRQMGINIPFANIFLDEPNMLGEVGIEGSKGLMNIKHFEMAGPAFKNPGMKKYYTVWRNEWKKFTVAPFNSATFEYPWGTYGFWTQQMYWFLSVVERAGSSDAEKIIPVFEGDSYQFVSGRVSKMRACDHKAVQGFRVCEFVEPAKQKQSMNMPPYYWVKNSSLCGPSWDIPAEKVLPFMDQNLDRCKGKSVAE